MLAERLPLVDEHSANFSGYEVVGWSAQLILYSRNPGFPDRSRYFFF
jgi:hypothetical protein